jgi:hypothetical protein
MSRLPKHVAALALFAALFVNSTAFAAPCGDHSPGPGPDLRARIKSIIVKILEDIRANFPGG